MRAGQEITILSKGAIVLSAATLDFAKSGRILFVGYDDNTIRVWDVLKVGGAVWRWVGLCGGWWGCVEVSGALWRLVGLCGGGWGCVEVSGAVWR